MQFIHASTQVPKHVFLNEMSSFGIIVLFKCKRRWSLSWTSIWRALETLYYTLQYKSDFLKTLRNKLMISCIFLSDLAPLYKKIVTCQINNCNTFNYYFHIINFPTSNFPFVFLVFFTFVCNFLPLSTKSNWAERAKRVESHTSWLNGKIPYMLWWYDLL
jgi:hypothetical protein